MNLRPKSSNMGLNLLVAMAVCLVVNFSYLLLLLVDQRENPMHPAADRSYVRNETGVLSVDRDGHGYLLYPGGDSVYVSSSRVRRLNLAQGDRIVADLATSRNANAHPVLAEIKMRNGEKFDYSALFNRPAETLDLTLQLLFYLAMSFILLTILTSARGEYPMSRFVRRCLWCLAVAAAFYCIAPVPVWRTDKIVLNFMSGHMFDYVLLLKCSFAVAVSMLYGRIYVLISQRQAVVVENERLKNENLSTRYNMLMGQINPHFFFNSLNSLAMLVREKDQERALTYIDQLSYTFRYIIQNGQATLTSLDEELKFAHAHGYLFKIRYADKLFIDIAVEEQYRSWLLPALSLQPLIDNAVKHNTITRSKPFHLSIRTEGPWLVVSNLRTPKLEPEPSTGIGLDNLRNRWQLITGCDIVIVKTDAEFTVRLPLQTPDGQ